MPAHGRTQIRDAVAAAVTGLATTGARVHVSRVRHLETLPALLVSIGAEQVTQMTQPFPRSTERRLEVLVEAAVAGADADDTLDQIILEVEEALADGTDLDGLARDVTLDRIEPVILSADGDRTYLAARMAWTVTWMAAENAPDTPL